MQTCSRLSKNVQHTTMRTEKKIAIALRLIQCYLDPLISTLSLHCCLSLPHTRIQYNICTIVHTHDYTNKLAHVVTRAEHRRITELKIEIYLLRSAQRGIISRHNTLFFCQSKRKEVALESWCMCIGQLVLFLEWRYSLRMKHSRFEFVTFGLFSCAVLLGRCFSALWE